MHITSPYLRDIGILAFVPDTWGAGVWQVRHQVLTRLSKYFNVVWLDPPVGWRKSVRAGIHRSTFDVPSASEFPGFEVYRHSTWAAKFYKPLAIAKMTEAARTRDGIRRLRERGSQIIICYLWRPTYAECLWAGDFDKRCYHIDDEYSFSVEDQPIDEYERQIITRVDQVFIHVPALMKKKGGLNKNTIYVPNGVDYNAYARNYDAPGDLDGIRGPVVLYTGVLKSQLDWKLLELVIQRRPQLDFVFVGPEGHLEPADRQSIETLRRRPNVHFIGGKSVDRLPAYAAHADVCIMPYKVDDYTKYIFPIKVNEYLAAGKPTIGTPIRVLDEFKDVVNLATTPEEWCDALDRCLREEPTDESSVAKRRAVAMQYEWDTLVRRIAGAFCALAGGKYEEQLEALDNTALENERLRKFSSRNPAG